MKFSMQARAELTYMGTEVEWTSRAHDYYLQVLNSFPSTLQLQSFSPFLHINYGSYYFSFNSFNSFYNLFLHDYTKYL